MRRKLLIAMWFVGLTGLLHEQLRSQPPVQQKKKKVKMSPMPADGRMVRFEFPNARLTADALRQLRDDFNRQLPADLRSYSLSDLSTAAEAAVGRGSQPVQRIRLTVETEPLRVTVTVE